MRLVSYREDGDGAAHIGLVIGERVVNLAAAAQSFGLGACHDDMQGFISAGDEAPACAREIAQRCSEKPDAGVALSSVRLLAPIPEPQRNVVCVGLNYAEHVAESKSIQGSEPPKSPVFFTKPPSCVIGPDAAIPWHGHVSTMIDWEGELAVVIGRRGRDIDETDALSHVFGYTVANDVTARDLQGRHQQWYKGKGLDGFCPLGPAIVTADEIPDPQVLDIATNVNGAEKQRSNTRHMIFSVARLIAEWSAGMTLLPGDVLLTGTPSGVGFSRTPPEYLKPRDSVEVRISGVGALRNTVAAGRE